MMESVSTAPWATILAVQLIVATLLLRLLWLTEVPQAVIFDEAYYVNASRVILGWPVPEGGHYADATPGIDPNVEHMPLAKLMFAGSMLVFGDTPLGWRLPSIILGTLAVGTLYLITRRLTGHPWLALLAAFLFSFDNLSLVHGRIATLDMPMVAFMLLGIYFYIEKRPALAGVMIALSTLAKFNGLVAIAAIVAFECLRLLLRPENRARIGRTAADLLLVVGTFTVALLVFLWPIDHYFTTYASPLDHITHGVTFGVSLRNDGTPQGIASQPWQWLMNETAITYYDVNVSTLVNGETVGTRPVITFTGQMNYFIISALPFALAYIAYGAVRRRRNNLPLMMLALFGAAFGQPLVFALLFHRISYIFYFLPALPALCAAIAYFLIDARLPRVVVVTYVAAVLWGFIATFPMRAPFG